MISAGFVVRVGTCGGCGSSKDALDARDVPASAVPPSETCMCHAKVEFALDIEPAAGQPTLPPPSQAEADILDRACSLRNKWLVFVVRKLVRRGSDGR